MSISYLRAFGREMLWILYALYFVPSQLKTHLRQQIKFERKYENPIPLIAIVDKLEQASARRYLTQLLLWCVIFASPILWQLVNQPHLGWGDLGLTWLVVICIGVGLVFWDGRSV